MTKVQKDVIKVLNRLAKSVENDEVDAQTLSDNLEGFLDELRGDDFFGTEAQNDPRGDGRDALWSMNRIQK
jgi:hypothetical protein